MSNERRGHWDDRNREGTPGPPEPSVAEMLPLLPKGLALDIGAGLGRNAIALAEAGLRVIAADYSVSAAQALHRLARERGLAIVPVLADIEVSFPLKPGSFDLVVNVNFLNRALVPHLIEALRPGGILLFDTF
ncbi:MAG: class I SAM-dependent methyltransferase, partial [Candidatus Binataceae bacterium]